MNEYRNDDRDEREYLHNVVRPELEKVEDMNYEARQINED